MNLEKLYNELKDYNDAFYYDDKEKILSELLREAEENDEESIEVKLLDILIRIHNKWIIEVEDAHRNPYC